MLGKRRRFGQSHLPLRALGASDPQEALMRQRRPIEARCKGAICGRKPGMKASWAEGSSLGMSAACRGRCGVPCVTPRSYRLPVAPGGAGGWVGLLNPALTCRANFVRPCGARFPNTPRCLDAVPALLAATAKQSSRSCCSRRPDATSSSRSGRSARRRSRFRRRERFLRSASGRRSRGHGSFSCLSRPRWTVRRASPRPSGRFSRASGRF